MIELILDASQLTAFESCERSWYYSYHQHLTSKFRNKSLNLGSWYHDVLAYYYEQLPTLPILNSIPATLEYMQSPALLTKYGIVDSATLKFHLKRMRDYLHHYMFTDEKIKVIAVEKGFSYLLYEDTDYRFILEGKIDLVAHIPTYGLTVWDHKTQSRKENRYPFNHQVMNYFNYVRPAYFIYNYIGLQENLSPGHLRREFWAPTSEQLEVWLSDVLGTFERVATRLQRTDLLAEDKFRRSRTACVPKYGKCEFYKICNVPDDNKWVPTILTAYKQKEQKWAAWSGPVEEGDEET